MTEQERFENEVNDAISNTNNNINNIKICDTPELLLKAGFQLKPILYSRSHLRKDISEYNESKHQHGVNIKDIFKLPKHIGSPAIILKNYKDKNKPILIFDSVNSMNFPLFSVIDTEKEGIYNFEKVDSNYMLSIHGKRRFDEYLSIATKNNEIVYYDYKKIKNLEALTGLPLSNCTSRFKSNIILQQIEINVNNKACNEIKMNNLLTELGLQLPLYANKELFIYDDSITNSLNNVKQNGQYIYKNLNKGENNIMENEKKKAMWVTIPERYIHEFTKEFTSDQKGNALPEPVTKKYYAVNIPTKDGKNMSFFVNAKVQHPQVKNYAIIPINEGERGVTFSHLEKDENGKNSYVKEEPVVKLSQSHLSEIVKEAFSKINDEAIKYLIVPKDNVDEKSFYSYDVDGHKESKSAFKVTLPNYMQDYQGHKLAGATMLAPFQYENTKDENLAVFRIDENATIKLWENGDENKTFNITGKELIEINKSSYKESKKETSKGNDLDQEELPTLNSAGNIKNEAVCIDCMINGKNEGNTQENTNFNENKGDEFTKK